MPNHITNRLELIGSINDIDAIIKKFGNEIPATINLTHDGDLVICKKKTEEWGFCWLDLKTGKVSDRNGLDQVGMPDGYEIEINQGVLAFPCFKKVVPPPTNDAYHDLPNQDEAKKSPDWWYNWNTKNWGTKWDGYSFRREAINVFIFETAWNSVPVIIEAMSKAFPEITINYTYADEDTGHNVGELTYKNGLQSEYIPDGGSVEAYDIYFKLHPESKSEYKLTESGYQYIEEETEA